MSVTGSDFMDLATVPAGMESKLAIRYAHTNKALDAVWRRFVAEVVPTYHALNRNARPRSQFQPGDLVLYLESRDRGRWPLARVHKVENTDRDGQVRTVLLKYKNALYRRAVSSLLLLEAATPPDLS